MREHTSLSLVVQERDHRPGPKVWQPWYMEAEGGGKALPSRSHREQRTRERLNVTRPPLTAASPSSPGCSSSEEDEINVVDSPPPLHNTTYNSTYEVFEGPIDMTTKRRDASPKSSPPLRGSQHHFHHHHGTPNTPSPPPYHPRPHYLPRPSVITSTNLNTSSTPPFNTIPASPPPRAHTDRPLPPPYHHHHHRFTSTTTAAAGTVNTTTTTTTATFNSNRQIMQAGPVDPEIDEHFRRSLGRDYHHLFAAPPHAPDPSTDSVDDHFAKALGETWIRLQAKRKDTTSSTTSTTTTRGGGGGGGGGEEEEEEEEGRGGGGGDRMSPMEDVIISTSSSSSSSSSSSNTSVSEKIKNGLSDALTITKVSTGETSSSASLSSSFLASSQPHTAPASLDDKPPVFSVDKAKASPPKNRKGPSLSDIVDKLRVGVGNSSDAVTIIEKNDKGQKESSKGDSTESKKEGEKKTEFTVKPSTGGLKLTINKAKKKDESSKSLSSSSPKPSVSKSPSGLKPGVVSGPASKKVSMSSLPPIPKLPRSSVSSVTATAVSPLGTTLPGMHSSPLQYQRERSKEKEKDRGNSADRLKPKDSSPAKSLGPISEPKKESISKTPLPKQTPKEEHSLSQSHRKLESAESTEKPSKTVSESRIEKLDKPGPLKAEADSTLGATSDPSSTSTKTPDTFMDKGSSTTTTTSTSSSSNLTNDTSTTSTQAIPLAAAPSSSSDLIRSQDSFSAPSFKSSKDTKEDGKSKSEASLPPYRPAVTSSSTSGGTVDHILDPTPPPLPPPPPPPPPPPSTTSTTVSSPAISPLRQSPLHTTLAKGMDSKEPVSASTQDPVPEKTKISESLSSSISSAQTTSLPGLGYPPSPSVSIKIVKSPAPVPSPLNMISPHSVASQPSPCIIDDELMDEALMGTRK